VCPSFSLLLQTPQFHASMRGTSREGRGDGSCVGECAGSAVGRAARVSTRSTTGVAGGRIVGSATWGTVGGGSVLIRGVGSQLHLRRILLVRRGCASIVLGLSRVAILEFLLVGLVFFLVRLLLHLVLLLLKLVVGYTMRRGCNLTLRVLRCGSQGAHWRGQTVTLARRVGCGVASGRGVGRRREEPRGTARITLHRRGTPGRIAAWGKR
jgi:hypothetical protein